MHVSPTASLIDEIEAAIQSGSPERRSATLRRVTDLFVANADRFNDQQIDVFDDVLGFLVQKIESKALAELSGRLSSVKKAPQEVMRRMAHDDQIDVAGPVLTSSECLTTDDLVEISKTKGQAHLLAISSREHLAESVTDALLQRGDRDVDQRVAGNSGARFSDSGMQTLVSRAEKDEYLAEKVCARRDIPLPLVRQLVLGAAETVRAKLLAATNPASRAEIESVLSRVSNEVRGEVASEHDYAEARRLVLLMKQKGALDEVALLEFARTRRYEEMICALAVMCSVPIPLIVQLLHSEQSEVFLIPCKAAGITWPAVAAILNARSPGQPISQPDLARAKADYHKLSKATAERVLRFWQVRESAQREQNPRHQRTKRVSIGS